MRQAPDASLRRGSAAALRGAHVRRQRYVQRLPLHPLTTPSKTLPCTVTDMFVWLNVDGLAGGAASRLPTAEAWKKHSLSAIHNQLWTGDSACTIVMLSRFVALFVSANPESITIADKFDASINDSHVFATSGYTTIIPTSESEALIGYNRCKPQLSILWLLTRRSRNDYCHRLPARRRRAWLLQGKRGGLLNGVCHEALAPQKGAGGQG